MSRKGNCWDNNAIERLFQILKPEWIRDNGYVNFSEASVAITDDITGYYSELRAYKYNCGFTPNESARLLWKNLSREQL
ncbi:transposase [Pantoea stewartii]|nr:transposase [Pantoea stewartii]KHN62995.1 transposase [Pantoea stewartii]